MWGETFGRHVEEGLAMDCIGFVTDWGPLESLVQSTTCLSNGEEITYPCKKRRLSFSKGVRFHWQWGCYTQILLSLTEKEQKGWKAAIKKRIYFIRALERGALTSELLKFWLVCNSWSCVCVNMLEDFWLNINRHWLFQLVHPIKSVQWPNCKLTGYLSVIFTDTKPKCL